MPTGEAIDLVRGLRRGSRYMASVDARMEWTNADHRLADIVDDLWRVIYLMSDERSTENAPRMERPGTAEAARAAAEAARARARRARETIESTEWEEVPVDG